MPLLLCFSISGETFGLDVREVIRILPRVRCAQLPGAPDYVVGLMDLEGGFVPVVDACRLMGRQACRELFSTRIVLVRFPLGEGRTAPLGLMVENATEMVRMDDQALAPATVSHRAAPFLAAIGTLGDRPLQIVDVSALLPPETADLIFAGVQGDEPEARGAEGEP
ncbi:MAG: chemotaxis protein CheW [Thermodesulfobacteriota bacterium]